jgi:UPF0755 protein
MIKKVIISIFLIITLVGAGVVYHFYQMIYEPNVVLKNEEAAYLFIKSNSNFEDLVNVLHSNNFIKDRNSFEWVAERKNYIYQIKPGRYLIKTGMNNDELVNLLRSGKQEPLKLTYNNIRLMPELAGVVAKQIEADSISLMSLFNNKLLQEKYRVNQETFRCLFIPNTYEFYWNTSAEDFISRMVKEYETFWNEGRLQKAEKIGLTPHQVSVLASIVQKETSKNDEKPRVAGVYLNRLKTGMLLQADPTLIYALGDFTIKRVLNVHKEIDSPYNTYKYKDLPPGPICLPEISSLDAVLNAENHSYYYFCAKEDFSGYHNFARTYAEHKVNANKWYKALNALKVYK